MIAAVLAFLSSSLGRIVAIAGAGVLACALSFAWGWRTKGRFCEAANARAVIAALQRDRDLAAQAVADAEKAAEELRALDAQHQESIRELQDRLAKVPADRRCALSDDDVRGLQRLKR